MIISRFLRDNLPIKLLALALAAALWLMASGARQEEREIMVPVALQNIPAGLAVENRIPPGIRVMVSGPRFSLRVTQWERKTITLDLSGLGEGISTFGGLDRHLNIPPGISVSRIYPSTIEVRLASLKKKRKR